jgi:translation initiation factor 1
VRAGQGPQGKTVTTVSGVPLDDEERRELASTLKHLCGTGGSVKDGVLVIQGDHCDVLVSFLQKRGYVVKRSGG